MSETPNESEALLAEDLAGTYDDPLGWVGSVTGLEAAAATEARTRGGREHFGSCPDSY